jgi:hypothetical protein
MEGSLITINNGLLPDGSTTSFGQFCLNPNLHRERYLMVKNEEESSSQHQNYATFQRVAPTFYATVSSDTNPSLTRPIDDANKLEIWSKGSRDTSCPVSLSPSDCSLPHNWYDEDNGTRLSHTCHSSSSMEKFPVLQDFF